MGMASLSPFLFRNAKSVRFASPAFRRYRARQSYLTARSRMAPLSSSFPPPPPLPLLDFLLGCNVFCTYCKSSGSTLTLIEATEPNLLLLNFFLTASRSPPSRVSTREICHVEQGRKVTTRGGRVRGEAHPACAIGSSTPPRLT